ncbi:MAG TPA: hypothetical protein VGE43_01505 [Acidimicrobiales bacterium]
MTPRLRKLALTAHVTVSVGWLGAVACFLALVVAGLTSPDATLVRATYVAAKLLGWAVIVPCSLAALLTGLVVSLGTEWGLFRHYWVLAKFLLNVVAATLLLLHMQPVNRMADVAATEAALAPADHRPLRVQLVADAGLALVVLLAATALSVYKPWGRGRRGRAAAAGLPLGAGGVDPVPPARWKLYLLAGVVLVVSVFVALHLAGGGRHH